MTDRLNAFSTYQNSMTLFSRDIVGLPLHPYQTGWANYVLDTVAQRRNEVIVVEMPRQSGKNETSAQLEVALLARHGRRGGGIVKTAPTWKPQIVNSKMRFDARSKQAAKRLPFLKFQSTQGYIYKCHQAELQFLSADPAASVVGATASLLMEVDEAQDIDPGKFDKDFSPMRASTGAPIVAYGTTWTDDTLLERFKTDVQEGRANGRIFRVLPEVVAESNPAYGGFVEGEVRRLGRQHPLVKTQYFLEPLAQAGRMIKPDQLRLMVGQHERQERRRQEAQIVAGLDFAGADEVSGELISLGAGSERDSVALTIGAVEWVRVAEGLIVPHIRMLDRYEWVNLNPASLHTTLYDILWNRWQVDRVHCDATGIGSASTAFLAEALNLGGIERVHGVNFDGAWKTHTQLTFGYLALINGARLKDYQPVDAAGVSFNPLLVAGQETPPAHDASQHVWWQRAHVKLQGRPEQRVKSYVPESEGHDDLLRSEELMVDAAHALGVPRRQKPRSRAY